MSYDFALFVDGRQLYKPVNLRRNPAGYTTHKISKRTQNIYGKELSYHGYIVVQEGTQLHPDELRGILIRIKNVAIGYYDPTMLDYRINQGPRSRWLTGEIFVDEGLEDALNIDRDSFNRVHPEFRAVQQAVHEALGIVFSEVYRKIDIRSDARVTAKEKTRRSHLGHVISQVVDPVVTIRPQTVPTEEGATPQVVLKESKDKLEVELPQLEDLQTKKSNKPLAAAILAIFEVAMREKTGEKRKEAFTNLLLDLLNQW